MKPYHLKKLVLSPQVIAFNETLAGEEEGAARQALLREVVNQGELQGVLEEKGVDIKGLEVGLGMDFFFSLKTDGD